MIEGKCPKCNERYYGWALRFVRNRYCNICGTALEIIEDDQPIPGYSPFEAEEYKIKDNSEIHEKDKPEIPYKDV